MPTYEFRCPKGHEFERFYRKISDGQAELPCPECGALAVRKVSGGAGLVFKGSGFYLTDYGKNAHAKKDGKPAPSGETTGVGGGETKPAAASESPSASGESKSAPAEPKAAPAESKTTSSEPTKPKAESKKSKRQE